MCIQCVKEGIMTQEEYDKEVIEGRELMNNIRLIFNGKDEEIVINTLLCALINVSGEIGVNPVEIMLALANGFSLAKLKKEQKETLN